VHWWWQACDALWNAYGQVPSLLVVAIFGGNGGIEYY
jgi:hypothetical protein